MTTHIEPIARETELRNSGLSGRAPLSVIVLTQDEALNIGPCLESVDWADDIVVVDSGSRDRTLELAVDACPRVRILEHPFKDFGDQRNWALDRGGSKHEWILFMDADERSTPDFAVAIRNAILNGSDYSGYFLTYRNFFLGKWLKRSTLFPTWQARLVRKGKVRFQREGHGQRECSGTEFGWVEVPFHHFPFSKGIHEWVDRHNRYSTDEVDLLQSLQRAPLGLKEFMSRDPITRRRCAKRIAARLPCRFVLRFLYVYIYRRGFLDGRAGFLYSLLISAYEVQLAAKLVEARERGMVP